MHVDITVSGGEWDRSQMADALGHVAAFGVDAGVAVVIGRACKNRPILGAALGVVAWSIITDPIAGFTSKRIQRIMDKLYGKAEEHEFHYPWEQEE